MKVRFSTALLAAIMLGFVGPAPAAEASESPPAQIAMEQLSTRLNLTPEQQEAIAPALERRNSRLRELGATFDGPEASRRQRLKALREARSIQQAFVREVSPMLSQEQQTEWEKLREEMRDGARERLQERRSDD
jgi:predicted outer membrane protein